MDLLGSLAGLVGQEAPEESEDEQLDEGVEVREEEEEEGDQEGDPRPATSAAPADAAPKLSFWGVASALTATVKARTAEVLTAVQETDWRAELEAFQQGAKEDAAAVGKGADIVVHKARKAAEHLPAQLQELHLPASLHLPESAATLQARAGKAREKAEKGLASLGALGSKLVLGTHDLFEQISHAVQNELALTEQHVVGSQRSQPGAAGHAGQQRYSRFDADVAAMQRDSSTYCDEPEDAEEFEAWLAGFDLADRKPDIDRLIAENTFMAELQARIVPLIVEYDAFWTRYFYRLHRLEQKHAQFQQLTERTLAAQEVEEVGWGSDEDEEQSLAAASPISTAPSLPAAAPPGAAQQTAQLAAQQAAGRGACDGLHPSSSTLPAEEAQRELLQEGEQAEAAEAAAAAEQPLPAAQEAVNAREIPVAAGTACPAVTISSDTSVASGEHWQVVTSSKPAAGGEEEEEEQPPQQQLAAAQQQQQQQQQQEKQAATADAKAEAAEGKLAAAAAAGKLAATGAAAAGAAAGAGAAADDEQLSDWGDEDDAALEAAAAGTTGEGAAGGDSDWGSDWE